ncbi:hypothetical protein ABBQ38_005583 [Trebouxia sp. C0009 RCD-2024]
MAEHASKQTVAHPRGDLEMSDIRLLDEEDDDDLIFGQSNLTSVLANPDFGRRRPWDRFLNVLKERPHPLFNAPAAGFAALALVFLILFLVSALSRSTASLAPGSDTDAANNQGSVHDDSKILYDYKGRPRMVSSQQGMVAADQGDCSAMGMAILRQGGNAVDSAITTTLCQGIKSPAASGLGGGFFMIIRSPNGTTEVIDAREVAPAAATENMFKGRPDAAVHGGLAIAIPLELKGLWLAHQRHGSLPWADLVTPVIPLARDGFPLHPYLADEIGDGKRLEPYPSMYETFMLRDGPRWRPPAINETCCMRPRLAATLQQVARGGPDVVYTGQAGQISVERIQTRMRKTTADEAALTEAAPRISQVLAAEIQAAGGIVSAQDLEEAQPSIKQPITTKVWGHELIMAPPPSSGAVVMLALHILQEFAAPFAGGNALGSHHLVEAMKHAFALRMQLGDPGPDHTFLDLDEVLADMLSTQLASQLQQNISDNSTHNFTAYGGQYAQSMSPEDHGTSHLSVVDSQRGVVAVTTTINTMFGSMFISNSTGLLLNNEMDDFSTPEQANVYGLAPSAPNFIRPGKKPLSSMSPTLVLDPQGRLVAALGASGGPRIITAVLQTLIRLLAFGQDALQAVARPRLHHQLLPDLVLAEHWSVSNTTGPSFMVSDAQVQGLRARGHVVDLSSSTAVTQAIVVDPDQNTLIGASDPRKDGAPAGF